MTILPPVSPRLAAAVRSRGARPELARPLAGDGSDRRFYRLPGAPPLVLLWHPEPAGEPVTENDSYVHIGRHLHGRGLPVPEIYEYCREEGWVLMEDLGNLSLEEALAGACTIRRRKWYEQALALLVDLEVQGTEGFDPAWCFDTPTVTPAFLLERECGYFLREFVRGWLGLEVSEEELRPDFDLLTSRALAWGSTVVMHRDFQSRNFLVQGDRLRLIDFQGARLGPRGYDAAALLIDPYVNLPLEEQEQLLAWYVEAVAPHLPASPAAFRETYDYLALSRNLQVLGAFAFLTRVKGKPQFARSIAPALEGLKRRLAPHRRELPRLAALLAKIERRGAQ